MKGKKTDKIDNAEIIIDPTKVYGTLPQIKEQLKKTRDNTKFLEEYLSKMEIKIERDTRTDENLNRKETIKVLKKHLDNMINDLKYIQTLDATARERLYFLLYNYTISVYSKCIKMRASGFGFHAIKYLAWVITVLESNVVLSGIKFLKWKIKCYLELAQCYEDMQYYKPAFKVVSQALISLNNLKATEELQSLPNFINSKCNSIGRVLLDSTKADCFSIFSSAWVYSSKIFWKLLKLFLIFSSFSNVLFLFSNCSNKPLLILEASCLMKSKIYCVNDDLLNDLLAPE